MIWLGSTLKKTILAVRCSGTSQRQCGSNASEPLLLVQGPECQLQQPWAETSWYSTENEAGSSQSVCTTSLRLFTLCQTVQLACSKLMVYFLLLPWWDERARPQRVKVPAELDWNICAQGVSVWISWRPIWLGVALLHKVLFYRFFKHL